MSSRSTGGPAVIEPSAATVTSVIKTPREQWADLAEHAIQAQLGHIIWNGDAWEATGVVKSTPASDEVCKALVKEIEDECRNPQPMSAEHFDSIKREVEEWERHAGRNEQVRQRNLLCQLYGVQRILSPPRTRENSPSRDVLTPPEPQISPLRQDLVHVPVPWEDHRVQGSPDTTLQQPPSPPQMEQQTGLEQSLATQPPFMKPVQQIIDSTQTSTQTLLQLPPAEQNGIDNAASASEPTRLPSTLAPSKTTRKKRPISPEALPQSGQKVAKIVKRSHRNQAGAGRAKATPTPLLELAFAGREVFTRFQEENRR